jgi:uncharacterized membrane protein (UPF0127 family)
MRRRTAVTAGLTLVTALGGCAGLGTAPESSATETPTPDGEETPTDVDASATATPTATPTPTTPASTPGSDYETTAVDIVDADGTRLATVDVWVADTFQKRYTGLSDTSALADGQGMLFVHDQEAEHTYVMRDMAFPLDMVFVAADGTITTIHRAPVESDGDLTRYSGRAKYVLEVPMGYTNETGVEVGDRVVIEGV